MIWGDTDLLRRITITVGDDPAIDQLLVLYDHPQGLAPEAAESWAAVRAGIVAGAAETEAATLVASTLPDLIDDQASGELADRGVPAIAGLRTALACAQAPARPARRARVACSRSPSPPRRHGRADDRERRSRRRLDRRDRREGACSGRPGWRCPRAGSSPARTTARAAVEELGGRVALKLGSPGLLHKSEARRAATRSAKAPTRRRAAYRELSASPAADGARVLVERMVPPGVELLVAARSDAVVPALVVGLGGIWTEALDDVAIVPLPASAERVEAAIRSLRGAAGLGGGRGREPVDLAERRRARRGGGLAGRSSAASI